MSMISLGNSIDINYNFRKVDGKAETLVFMNGTFNVSKDWEHTCNVLAEKFPCNILTYDMRNQGGSTKITKDFEYNDLVEDTKLLFEKLDLNDITIITYSSASTIAVDYIVNNPGKVKRLIMGAPVVNPFGSFKNQLISKVNNRLFELGNLKDIISFSFPIMCSSAFCEQNKEHFGAIQEMFNSNFDKEVLLPFMKAWDQNEMTLKKMQTIENSVETHLIYGEEDLFNPPVFLEELKKNIKEFKFHRIDNVGHAFHMENMAEFERILGSILIK